VLAREYIDTRVSRYAGVDAEARGGAGKWVAAIEKENGSVRFRLWHGDTFQHIRQKRL
jgi:hypothetical protein